MKTNILLIITVLVFTLLLTACGGSVDRKVLIIGDSLVSNWTERLLPSDTINLGIGGETTDELIDRFHIVNKYQVDVIYVLSGKNDIHQGIEQIRIKDNLLTLRYLTDTPVVYLTIPPSVGLPFSDFDEINQAIINSDVTCVNIVDIFYSDGQYRNLLDDGVHFSENGYIELSNRVL